MCSFLLKSYSPKQEISNPHFFILCKGNNSGKPLLSPCPNCFVIQFLCEEEKEQVYWLLYSLWQSRTFYPFLRGSVIPFILLRDVKSCINDYLDKSQKSPEQFKKLIVSFQSMNQIESQLMQNLKAIDKAKRMLLYQLIR